MSGTLIPSSGNLYTPHRKMQQILQQSILNYVAALSQIMRHVLNISFSLFYQRFAKLVDFFSLQMRLQIMCNYTNTSHKSKVTKITYSSLAAIRSLTGF